MFWKARLMNYQKQIKMFEKIIEFVGSFTIIGFCIFTIIASILAGKVLDGYEKDELKKISKK